MELQIPWSGTHLGFNYAKHKEKPFIGFLDSFKRTSLGFQFHKTNKEPLLGFKNSLKQTSLGIWLCSQFITSETSQQTIGKATESSKQSIWSEATTTTIYKHIQQLNQTKRFLDPIHLQSDTQSLVQTMFSNPLLEIKMFNLSNQKLQQTEISTTHCCLFSGLKICLAHLKQLGMLLPLANKKLWLTCQVASYQSCSYTM